MRVDSRNFVSIFKHPLAVALRFVVVEVALEVTAVRVLPLAGYHLPLKELANELLTRFGENVRAFAVFLTIGPVS